MWNGKKYIEEGPFDFEREERNVKIKHLLKANRIFEGEYLNGEKNGKGKEYFRPALKFKLIKI